MIRRLWHRIRKAHEYRSFNWSDVLFKVMIISVIGLAASTFALLLMVAFFPDPTGKLPTEDPNTRVVYVDVDGRQVSCVLWDPPGSAGNLTCDWSAK